MPVATIVVIVVILVLLCMSLFVVSQQRAYIIERFGRFHRVAQAGLHCRIPFVDAIVHKTDLRVLPLDVKIETKTRDNAFVTIEAATQYRVNPADIKDAYYELRDPEQQIRSYIEDALRSAVANQGLDETFAKKDDIAREVQQTVGAEMSAYGYIIVKTLVKNIDPNAEVKAAMDSINAAEREKEATKERAEANRIAIETRAEAEARKTMLQGQGQANYRKELAEGIVGQIRALREVGMDIASVNNIVMFNQYLDVLRSMAESHNAKTVVLPASTPGGYGELMEQMTQALVAAQESAGDGAGVADDGAAAVAAPTAAD